MAARARGWRAAARVSRLNEGGSEAVRTFVVPTAIGSALFYAVLGPLARWLAFGARVSDAIYAATVWSLLVVVSLFISFLVARESGLRLSRTLVASAASTLTAVLALVAALVLVESICPAMLQALSVYLRPASVSVALAAAVSATTLVVIRVGRPEQGSS